MKLVALFYKTPLISLFLAFGFNFFSTNSMAQDTDFDTVNDSIDLDDDNDGIIDVVESLGFDPMTIGSCDFPEIVFHADQVAQVGGNPGAPFVGDQFRFSNVVSINAIPLDAVITITEADANITSFIIDRDDTGNPDAWQAEYNVPAGQNATMKFLIEFKVANTNSVVELDRFGGVFYDIDGANANESITLGTPDFYAVEKTTELNISTDLVSGDVTFQGPVVTYPGVVLDTDIAMYFNYFNINSFTFATTGNNVTAANNSNLFSLLFNVCEIEEFTDFDYVINSGIDTDGNGVADHLDNDSDNDGCYDAIEALGNFDFTDIDLISGQLIGNVDLATGIPIVAGSGQESGTDVIQIGPDLDADGISDACDGVDDRVDTDNDGLLDISDSDDDNDGILDKDEGGPFCDNSVLTSINTEGLLKDIDLSGQLPIVLNSGLYSFNATIYDGTGDSGTPQWGNGVQIKNDQGTSIGDYLYLQTKHVGQKTSGDYVDYEFTFPNPLESFKFSVAGLNKSDYVEIVAYNGATQIPISASKNFTNFTPGLGSGLWDVGENRVVGKSTTGGTLVNINYFIATIVGPVTRVVVSSGHGDNTDGTSTIAFHTVKGCYAGDGADIDNDGIKDYLDTDSDGDGCSDVDEVYALQGTDTNDDGTWGEVITMTDINGIGLVSDAGLNGAGVAYNTLGPLAISGTKTHKEATQVTIQGSAPDSKSQIDGNSETFTVSAEASAATSYVGGTPVYGTLGNANAGLNYQWQRNDVDIDVTLDGGIYTNFNTATLNISDVIGLDGNVYKVMVTTVDNVCFYFEKSATLSTGIVNNDLDGDGDPNATDPDPNDPCVWGVSQVLVDATTSWNNSDCDGDGVSNINEINPPDSENGTNPLDPCDLILTDVTLLAWDIGDCDGDGVSNADEINSNGAGDNQTDPNNPCDFNVTEQGASHVSWDNSDCDGDGVINKTEVDVDGTNPYDPCSLVLASVTLTASDTGDCDQDGVTNADEINAGIDGQTDPNNPCDFNMSEQGMPHIGWDNGDCDGDGVINKTEVDVDGTSPFDPCSLILTSVSLLASNMDDCDGDGVSNADEINSNGVGDLQTDPNNPCDFNIGEQGNPDVAWTLTDCDLDGNLNGIDPNPKTPTANDDNGIALYGTTTSIDILGNDDFLPNDGNTIIEIAGGTSGGAIVFNSVTGGMQYTPLANEPGTTVTVLYRVCHNAVCDMATVTIIIPPAGDLDGDGDLDNTDPAPNDPCIWSVNQVLVNATMTWNNADCDGDGVTNLKEVDPNETSFVDPSGTNPNDPCDFVLEDITLSITNITDCDGDGVTNADEINFTTGDPQTDHENPCDYNENEQGTVDISWGVLDCDNDGNPNSTDPNPKTPTANDDADTAPFGEITTIDILFNDDFLPNDGNTIIEIAGGTAMGIIEFDSVTGTMDYSPLESEEATVVTVNYKVCQGVVCAEAVVTITIPAPSDDDGDGDPNTTDPEPNDPCIWGVGQVLLDATMTWKNADCDGDGVTNLKEVDPNGSGFVDPSGTNPTDPCDFVLADITLAITNVEDCDGDGVSNADEINAGSGDPQTDPNDPCDFNPTEQGAPSANWNSADCDGDGNPNGTDLNPSTPTAIDDAFLADFGSTTSFDILENDDFLENDGNTIAEVTGGTAKGTIIFHPVNGNIDYTPLENEQAMVVTVHYEVCQGTVCDQAIITITVGAIITVVNDNETTLEDVPVVIDIFSNDSFLPNDGSVTNTMPSNGILSISNPNNSNNLTDLVFTYKPNPDFNGTDTFEYTVCDNDNSCVTATVTIIVIPVMDLMDDEYVTDEDVSIDVDILVNDNEIPNKGTISATEPSHGTISISDPNSTPNDPSDDVVSYFPDLNYNGEDSFIYTVCDNSFPSGVENCFTANVIITILPINDPPVAEDDMDIPLSGNLLPNDHDPDGDRLTTMLVKDPIHGTVTLDEDGTYIYIPDPGFVGIDSFIYRICDTGTPQLCDEATAFLRITEPRIIDCAVPNVMTPDGDGVNDELIIDCIGIYPNNELKIYNRWGDVVFQMTNYDNSWKATHDRLDVPAGTYFYFLKLDPDTDQVLQGFITIVR